MLGEINMDLKAPCDVMREYVQRAFRKRLNEVMGDSFLFLARDANGKQHILQRKEEPRTYSEQYAPFIMNAKTLVGSTTITLVREAGVRRRIIPEFLDDAAAAGTAGGDVMSDSADS